MIKIIFILGLLALLLLSGCESSYDSCTYDCYSVMRNHENYTQSCSDSGIFLYPSCEFVDDINFKEICFEKCK